MPTTLPSEPQRAGRGAPRVIAAVTIWGGRLAWLLVAVIGGQAVGDALADHGTGAARALTVMAWVAWAAGAMALAVPSVLGLTVARVLIPGALVVAGAAAVGGASAGADLALAVPALVASVLVLGADVGRTWVQASAYGDEERFPLRPPAGYLAASIGSWLVWTVAVITSAVAWTDGNGLVAVPVTAVVAAGLLLLPRRWHQLSRRWFVLVPAGVVVHDPVVLGETLMLPRRQIAGLRMIRLGPDREVHAADLTGPTAGVGIEVSLHESATALFAPRPGLPKGRAVHLTAFVVGPSRPGAALSEALRRRLPVT